MICGVNIGGKDTLEEWGLMLCNDLSIGAAVPRYRFIEIPEMSGALDLTEALTGSVPYDQRTITFTLFAVHDVIASTRTPATEEHFQTVLARFSGFANGKRLHVYLPDNPDHYFVGRVSVGGKSGYNSGRVKVEVLADPYRLKDGETTLTVDDEDFFKTATPGALVTFDDGGDNLPMKSCVVSLVPDQDFNGYDSPWPGGGGKNKYPINIGEDIFTDNTGATHSNSDGILVVNCAASTNSGVYARINSTIRALIAEYSGPITYSFDIKASAAATIFAGYEAHGARNISVTTSWQRVTINTTGNGATDAFDVFNRSGSVVTVEVKNFMLQVGTVASATFSPYSNICPISGHTGAELYRTGKNLWEKESSYSLASSGTIIRNATLDIPLKAGSYTLSIGGNISAAASFSFRRSDSTIIGAIQISSAQYDSGKGKYIRSFQLADDAYRINLYVSGAVDINEIQLELGSSATAYEQYQGDTYSVTFPETIYGGSHDFVSGKAISTHEIFNLKGFNANSIYQYTFGGKNGVFFAGAYAIQAERDQGWCNVAPVHTDIQSSAAHYMWFGVNTAYVYWIGILDALGMTLDEFKTWIANNDVIITRRLASPVEYDLTPQEVTSMLGKNNVWSNDGDISELVYMFTDEIIINNEGMPAIPTINASEAGQTVTLRGASHVLAAGDNRFSDFVFQSGENVMQVEDPAGTLTIKYQEGML